MTATATPLAPRRRKPLLTILALLVMAGAIGAGTWYWRIARFYESTDDAYVNTHIVSVTPQIVGTVKAVTVQDTDIVEVGQLLVELDGNDAKIALEAAEAELAQTVRRVHNVYATNNTLEAEIAVHRATRARHAAEVSKARDDVETRDGLIASGAVGKEELKHAQTNLQVANAALDATDAAIATALERLSANKTLTAGVSVPEHPEVRRAAARVQEAHLAWQRTRIVAPIAGDIARRQVQVGQRVQPGAPLLSVVPLTAVWVDANFKEGQLRKMRIGQPAKVMADLYGKKVVYDGRVAGFGAGTGGAFALLPAQNASGNWIKIVQRVPVRIELEPAQLAVHPLRVGLSMVVEVELRDVQGDAPLDPVPATHVSATEIFDEQLSAAQARIDEIILSNLTGASPDIAGGATR